MKFHQKDGTDKQEAISKGNEIVIATFETAFLQ